MLVEAYSPMAHGELFKNTRVADIAQSYGVSLPQLSIRYMLQLGLLPLPKTANPDHLRTNADVDFEITKEDMEHCSRSRRSGLRRVSTFPVLHVPDRHKPEISTPGTHRPDTRRRQR